MDKFLCDEDRVGFLKPDGWIWKDGYHCPKLSSAKPRYAPARAFIFIDNITVPSVQALELARDALLKAEYAIKGREHTGFIHSAVQRLDQEIAAAKPQLMKDKDDPAKPFHV